MSVLVFIEPHSQETLTVHEAPCIESTVAVRIVNEEMQAACVWIVETPDARIVLALFAMRTGRAVGGHTGYDGDNEADRKNCAVKPRHSFAP
jgi:hypothetical protein